MYLLINKVKQWSYNRNIIKGSTSKDQFIKLVSEIGELADDLSKRDKEKIKDSIGDILVILINISEQEGLDLDECLEHAYNEIKDREGVMFNGVFVKTTDPTYENILKLSKEN